MLPSEEAFQYPTHVNIMTEDTLRLYFSESCWHEYMDLSDLSLWLLKGGGVTLLLCIKKNSETPLLEINGAKIYKSMPDFIPCVILL